MNIRIDLPDLEKSRVLSQFHGVLFKIFGIPIDYINRYGKNHFFGDRKQCNPLCAMIRSTPEGLQRCNACDEENIRIARERKCEHIYRCHTGLIDIVVPIFIRGIYCGALGSGQLLHAPPEEEHFTAFLKQNPYLVKYFAPEEIRELFFNSKSLRHDQILGICELLSLATNYVIFSEEKLKFLSHIDEHQNIFAARDYIRSHFTEPLSVQQIARKVHLSESHFAHLFKKETGMTPVNFINRCRISYAMELLRNENLPIIEIAFECGFRSLTHFNRTFRKYNAETPREYRKKAENVRNKAE